VVFLAGMHGQLLFVLRVKLKWGGFSRPGAKN